MWRLFPAASSVILFSTVSLLCCSVHGQELPPRILDAFQTMEEDPSVWMAAAGDSAFGGMEFIRKHKNRIEEIIDFATSSETSFTACAARVRLPLSRLLKYAGSERAREKAWSVGLTIRTVPLNPASPLDGLKANPEHPLYAVFPSSYLLLQLAQQKRSVAWTAEAVRLFWDVWVAGARLAPKRGNAAITGW